MKYTIYRLVFRLAVKLLVYLTDSVQIDDIWEDDGTILKGRKSSVGRIKSVHDDKAIMLFNPNMHTDISDVLNSAFCNRRKCTATISVINGANLQSEIISIISSLPLN